MTAHDIIYNVLLRDHDINEADQGAEEILGLLAAQGFVVVHASAVVREDGKVTVTRKLVEDVLVDAEWWVRSNYVVNGEVHPAMVRHFERDMEDIRALRAEIEEESSD